MVDAAEHLGLVHHLVREMRWARDDEHELVGLATEALLRAARDFDPSLGFRFSTFATRCIVNAIREHHRRERAVRRDVRRTVSLTENAERRLGACDAPGRMERDDARRDLLDRAAGVLAMLSDSEGAMLLERAGGATLEEVGARFGVCKERVRQIEQSAIAYIRERHGLAADGRGMAWITTKGQVRKRQRPRAAAFVA